MNRLSGLLDYLRPMIAKKRGKTCIISAIKGLVADEKTKELITPSQMIQSDLNHIQHKFKVVAMGGPFFDVDIALGKPVALTIAGPRSVAQTVRKEVLNFDRRRSHPITTLTSWGSRPAGPSRTSSRTSKESRTA